MGDKINKILQKLHIFDMIPMVSLKLVEVFSITSNMGLCNAM